MNEKKENMRQAIHRVIDNMNREQVLTMLSAITPLIAGSPMTFGKIKQMRPLLGENGQSGSLAGMLRYSAQVARDADAIPEFGIDTLKITVWLIGCETPAVLKAMIPNVDLTDSPQGFIATCEAMADYVDAQAGILKA